MSKMFWDKLFLFLLLDIGQWDREALWVIFKEEKVFANPW